MLEWTKVEKNRYEHTIMEGEPDYGTLMYAFGKDVRLDNPEINGVSGNKVILFSNNREMQNDYNAIPIPGLKTFVGILPLSSMGVADYSHDGKNRRIAFGLDREASLNRKEYVIGANFIPFDSKDCETHEDIPEEEINEILGRISLNAEAFMKMTM